MTTSEMTFLRSLPQEVKDTVLANLRKHPTQREEWILIMPADEAQTYIKAEELLQKMADEIEQKMLIRALLSTQQGEPDMEAWACILPEETFQYINN